MVSMRATAFHVLIAWLLVQVPTPFPVVIMARTQRNTLDADTGLTCFRPPRLGFKRSASVA